jgi:hypothetical protein
LIISSLPAIGTDLLVIRGRYYDKGERFHFSVFQSRRKRNQKKEKKRGFEDDRDTFQGKADICPHWLPFLLTAR